MPFSSDQPIRLSYGPHDANFGDLRVPQSRGPHPVVVSIHGGFWLSAFGLDLHDAICDALTSAGIATWNIEFRRVGDAGGGWPGTFQDVARAADFLLDLAPLHYLDLKRVVALGHSAGGHLALWLAARQKLALSDPLLGGRETLIGLRAVVALAGIGDLKRAARENLGGGIMNALLGGTPEQFPERYASASPIELLPLGVEQILIHGEKDNLVPLAFSQQYNDAARAKGDRVQLIALPDAGHFEVIDPQTREWMRVLQAVAEVVA